ncbi:unnamed protein product [Triticum turgidum subsp. durum]|uniref:Uncharacterized protein n=1 Tax=Triticum turgidum subsp. durum TaxID=4567 RepID=A0A9R1ACW5_TRITD|nr:unnamed protein product [Triticum turgidum subsp. durum]
MEGAAQLLTDGFAGSPLLGEERKKGEEEGAQGRDELLFRWPGSMRAGSSGLSPSCPGVSIAMDGLHSGDACFSLGRAMSPQVRPPIGPPDVGR